MNGCECILLLCARSLRVLRGVQRASVFKLVGALALELSPARLSQPALLRQLLLAVTRHVCTHATFATDGGDATDDVTTSANDGAGTRRMRLYNCLDIYVIGIYILILCVHTRVPVLYLAVATDVAQQVLDLLRRRVDTDLFTRCYSQIERHIFAQRASRKQQIAQLVCFTL